MKKILIPIGEYTDPTPLYQLPEIIRDFEDCEIVLFSVVTVPFTTSLDQEEIVDTEPYLRIRNKLSEVIEMFRNIGIEPVSKIVSSRNVPEAILEESITGEYDLIVLIKRMRHPKFISRSVSQAILSKIPRPLLILTMD
jgi:nucleotide-binding universal stress UspA family protein